MGKRKRPKAKDRQERREHSKEHSGQTGKFQKIYTEDVDLWIPDPGDHEVAVIPFLVSENTEFRSNADLNKPFSKEELKGESSYDHKLTVLIHYGVGVNDDAVLCLRTVGKTCPICEARDQLIKDDPYQSGTRQDRRPC